LKDESRDVYHSVPAPLSPSQNKLNLNFTFTNEKTKKLREDEFYNDLQKRLEENTDDIRRIKENLDGFKGYSTEKVEKYFSTNFFSSKIHIDKIDKSFIDKRFEKKTLSSRNEDFLNYLESLKNYKAEAISKTLNFNKRKRSAVLIQKAYRGYVVRKAYRELKSKRLLERCKRILLRKKKEYIQNNALTIIMKHMKNFVKKIKLRKKLIFKKFVNHCARLIQRFFKYRVRPFYHLKKQQFQQKNQNNNSLQNKPSQFRPRNYKNLTPDFSIIRHESNYSSLRATSVLKNETDQDKVIDNAAFSMEELPKKKSFEEQNKWEMRENMPIKGIKSKMNIEEFELNDNIMVKGSKNRIAMGESELVKVDTKNNIITKSKNKISPDDSEPNKWEMRENMPVGSQKDISEVNKLNMRENISVGGLKKKEEMNKWEMRENMPIGGSKNKGYGDDMFGGELEEPQYFISKKKPIKKHEFLKRNKKKISGNKEEEKEEETPPEIKIRKPSDSEEKPKSHFKNFSKNLSEINTQTLNNSMNEENRELTNTLSALTYESPLKTNFKKKSQLYSPALNSSGRSTPQKFESPKKPFMTKKKLTPKNKKETDDERSLSMKKSKETLEDEGKERHNFLKKRSAAVISQKLDWKNINSRTDCGLNKKSPPNSAYKTSAHQRPEMKSQSNSKKNNNQNLKKKPLAFNKTLKKGEVRETILIKNPEDDFRERMMLMRSQNQMENDFTASNFTLPENIPVIQINNMPALQLRAQNISDGFTSNDQNQLNQLIQMSSVDFRNTNTTNRLSENRREISTLSRIYKSESSINSSVKMERILAVEELERAYRTSYFGKLTSF